MLDTLEALFGGFANAGILRAELRRLFDWLKHRGVTAVITGERGDGALTRHGLEEYVSDCVILLDHRVVNQLSARRLRIVKYRGTLHGTDEYPFLIGRNGISVVPITSIRLDHQASTEVVSSGVATLDRNLGAGGFYRASTIMLSGGAGTAKSSIASHFVAESGRRGERSLYIALEESQSEIVRNMTSIGIQLAPLVKRGLLRFHVSRPTAYGLEMHLASIHQIATEYRPSVVVVDSVTSLLAMGSTAEVTSMIVRLVDFFKMNNVTLVMTALIKSDEHATSSSVNISVPRRHMARAQQLGTRRHAYAYAVGGEGARNGALESDAATHHVEQGCRDRVRCAIPAVGMKTVAKARTKTSRERPIKYVLWLYVAGETSKSVSALANLKKICDEHLEGQYRIKVIDLLQNPRLARDHQILALPTLVRQLPSPVRKIIGDLSNTERVLVGLDIKVSR